MFRRQLCQKLTLFPSVGAGDAMISIASRAGMSAAFPRARNPPTCRSNRQVIGSATVAWPLAARAHQVTLPTIGFLTSSSPDLYAKRLQAFHHGLNETGYIAG